MMAIVPDKYLDLLQRKKAFAIISTVMPDGSPQVTPVWFDYTNGIVRVNTARGRVKARWRWRSSIPTIPTATCRFAVGSGASPKTAPLSTSIRLPRNTSARTNTPTLSPAKSA